MIVVVVIGFSGKTSIINSPLLVFRITNQRDKWDVHKISNGTILRYIRCNNVGTICCPVF